LRAIVLALFAALATTVLLVRARGDGIAPSAAASPAPAVSEPRSGQATPSGSGPASAAPRPSEAPHYLPGFDPRTILVWVPPRLPAGLAAAAARLPGVAHAVPVVSGTAWMTGSTSPSGAVLDRPASGLAIPIDVAAADPKGYATLRPARLLGTVRDLAPGFGLLGEQADRLRRERAGGTLLFGSHRVRILEIVPDFAIGVHELFVPPATA